MLKDKVTNACNKFKTLFNNYRVCHDIFNSSKELSLEVIDELGKNTEKFF